MSDSPDDERGIAAAVDVTLIEEMLRLLPAERLRQNDRAAALAARLQKTFAAQVQQWPNRPR